MSAEAFARWRDSYRRAAAEKRARKAYRPDPALVVRVLISGTTVANDTSRPAA